MNARARGSFDWPSQNIACLRTWGFLFARARPMRSGTLSSVGNWLRAKTARSFRQLDERRDGGRIRVSPSFYNTEEEIERLLAALFT